MVIKNNRRSLITLEYKKDGNRTLVPVPAGSKIDVPKLIDSSDIINKDIFNKGWLIIVSEERKEEIKKEEKIQELTIEQPIKGTKVKKIKKSSNND